LQRRLAEARRNGRVLPEGYSLRADYQTSGKGRHGRAWQGDPGDNIAVSFALTDADLGLEKLFTLSQTAALSVRSVVETCLQRDDIFVKWPNDILVNRAKIAGILLETTVNKGQITAVVLGIGLNVNQLRFETDYRATSLALLLGRPLSVDDVFAQLRDRLEADIQQLQARVRSGDTYNTAREYHTHLFGQGEVCNFSDNTSGLSFRARVLGTSPGGHLRLEQAGEEQRYDFSEVTFTR